MGSILTGPECPQVDVYHIFAFACKDGAHRCLQRIEPIFSEENVQRIAGRPDEAYRQRALKM